MTREKSSYKRVKQIKGARMSWQATNVADTVILLEVSKVLREQVDSQPCVCALYQTKPSEDFHPTSFAR